MRNLGSRLENAERHVRAIEPPREFKRFYVEGNEPGVDVADFLRSQGHDIGPDVLAIITTIIPAEDGKAIEAPFVDVTDQFRQQRA